MKQFKQILKRLFFLPPLPTVLISLPSFAFVFYVLGKGIEGAAAYASYGLSAYAFTIMVTGVVRMIRAGREGVTSLPPVKKILTNPWGQRYVADITFRTEVSLYISLCMNILYGAIKMVSGIIYDSAWFFTLAIYYILLAVMQCILLTSARRRHVQISLASEFRRCRICGILLAVMTLALSGMILFLVRRDGGYEYPGNLIYVMAMYAFCAVITAVVNIVKLRKHGSPVLSAAKALSLTAALVSMLALETAMLNQFGSSDDFRFRQTMTAVSGGVACAIVLGMAIYMIVHATKKLKEPDLPTLQTTG